MWLGLRSELGSLPTHLEICLDVSPELEKSIDFKRENTWAIRMINAVFDG